MTIRRLVRLGSLVLVVIGTCSFSTIAAEACQAADEPIVERREKEPSPIQPPLPRLESRLLGATPEERDRLKEERKRLSAVAADIGEDPTAIIGYYQLAYGHNVLTNNVRSDTATVTIRVPVTPNWGVQVNVPYSWVNLNPSNGFSLRGGGDITTRMGGRLYASENIALFVGADVLFPTASERQLGTGKYAIGPGAALAAPLPRIRSVFVVTAADYNSVGGDPSRANVHFASFKPALITIWSERWWSSTALTWDIDWNKSAISATNVLGQVGYRIDKHWNIFAGPGVGVVGRDTRFGLDWTVQAGVRWVYTTPLLPKSLFEPFQAK